MSSASNQSFAHLDLMPSGLQTSQSNINNSDSNQKHSHLELGKEISDMSSVSNQSFAHLRLMPSGLQTSQLSINNSDSSQKHSHLVKQLTSPKTENTQSGGENFGQFYVDGFAVGDSAVGHCSKTTSLPETIWQDVDIVVQKSEKENPNGSIITRTAQCEETQNVLTSTETTKIERKQIRQPVTLTSRFSKVNLSVTIQADNEDLPVFRELTVTVVQASSRHPLHDYDLKFTRAQVLYNSDGDLLVIHTPYLQEGIYQVVPDEKLTPHPDMPDTFMRQCCLMRRPDTDKMALGSQYLILGQLKRVPKTLTETGDTAKDMFVKFAKSKDFLQVVLPILLGCGHKDVWSSQLELHEAIQPVCLNGNREAFTRWQELHTATPCFEDCLSDKGRFQEYMDRHFNTWDHVTLQCEYYKQMHTALCQGCCDCMSRESYIDSLRQRNVTTKVAYNATLNLFKTDGSSPNTTGNPRKKKKAGRKRWTKRSRASEERPLLSDDMSSINPLILGLDPGLKETYGLKEKLNYGFYKYSKPTGEDISDNSDTTADNDTLSSSGDSIEVKMKKAKELSEQCQQNDGTCKGESVKGEKTVIEEAFVHKDTSQSVHHTTVTSETKEGQNKAPKLNDNLVSDAKSANRKSSLGKRGHETVHIPNTNGPHVAQVLIPKTANGDSIKRKTTTTKRQRLPTEDETNLWKENTTSKDNNMETETTVDISAGRSRRNRKRKAICTCAGCVQSLIPPAKTVRLDADITKDDAVKQLETTFYTFLLSYLHAEFPQTIKGK